MLPLLFEIPIPFLDIVIPIHTYGFMIALGFLAVLALIKHLSYKEGIDAEKMVDLTFYSLLVGFVGARLLFVITTYEIFIHAPLEVFKVWNGGLVFYGGPLAVIPFIFWYSKRIDLPPWKVYDMGAIVLALAQAFGRMGCLGAGCCYGRPTGSDWGIIIDSPLVEVAWRGSVRLHPTQLYSSVSMLILCGCLYWIHRRRKFDGQVMLSFLFAYPMIRSIVETFRGDKARIENLWGMPLSTSQFISIWVVLGAAIILAYRLKTLNSEKGEV